MIKKALFSALLFTTAFFLQAHEFNPAHLVVKEIKANSYEAEWMYPVKNIRSTMPTTYTLVGQPVPAAARRPPPEQTETNHAANDQTNDQKAV